MKQIIIIIYGSEPIQLSIFDRASFPCFWDIFLGSLVEQLIAGIKLSIFDAETYFGAPPGTSYTPPRAISEGASSDLTDIGTFSCI